MYISIYVYVSMCVCMCVCIRSLVELDSWRDHDMLRSSVFIYLLFNVFIYHLNLSSTCVCVYVCAYSCVYPCVCVCLRVCAYIQSFVRLESQRDYSGRGVMY